MSKRLVCVDCGAKCGSNRPRKDTRCRNCWGKWIRENPQFYPNWKGGKTVNGNGYTMILINGKYFPEHRLVMEKYLGRKLKSFEIVHHQNENRRDNRIGNLQLTNRSQHRKLHKRTTVCKKCGKPERCKGLCKAHYAELKGKVPCTKCGNPTWKDKRSPKQRCAFCYKY